MTDVFAYIDDGVLKLAGKCENEAIEKNQSSNMQYLGEISREGISKLYSESRVGLCLLLPTANYINSLPTKIFEYMAAGLPVVSSNFPLCRGIIDGNKCGRTVDPYDNDSVFEAVKHYLDDPKDAQETGLRGKVAALKKYNWENEGKELLELYAAFPQNLSI